MKEVNLWSPCVVRVKGERKYVQHYDNKSIEFSTVKGEALIFENSHSIEDFAKKAVPKKFLMILITTFYKLSVGIAMAIILFAIEGSTATPPNLKAPERG